VELVTTGEHEFPAGEHEFPAGEREFTEAVLKYESNLK
jgi:hypothetical protein